MTQVAICEIPLTTSLSLIIELNQFTCVFVCVCVCVSVHVHACMLMEMSSVMLIYAFKIIKCFPFTLLVQ